MNGDLHKELEETNMFCFVLLSSGILSTGFTVSQQMMEGNLSLFLIVISNRCAFFLPVSSTTGKIWGNARGLHCDVMYDFRCMSQYKHVSAMKS